MFLMFQDPLVGSCECSPIITKLCQLCECFKILWSDRVNVAVPVEYLTARWSFKILWSDRVNVAAIGRSISEGMAQFQDPLVGSCECSVRRHSPKL